MDTVALEGAFSVAGPAVLLISVPLGRYIYIRLYLRKPLFLEPRQNLSGDESLKIGSSLSELLFFGLEKIREVLHRAYEDIRLSRGNSNSAKYCPMLQVSWHQLVLDLGEIRVNIVGLDF